MPIRSAAKQLIAGLLLGAACMFARSASALTWSAETVENPAASVGGFSDIALDASGRPHIVYRDATSFDLKRDLERQPARREAGAASRSTTVTFLRSRGFGIADLIYARGSGPSWGVEIADLDAPSIGQSSIALDASNLPQ